KRWLPLGGRGNRQVADAHVHADDAGMRFWRRVRCLHFQGHEEIKPLLGLVVPQLGRSNASASLDTGYVSVGAGVGNNYAPLEGQDADSARFLEAVVLAVLVGQRGRDIGGSVVQRLVPFRSQACL